MAVPILVANQPIIMCNAADRDPLQNRFTGPEIPILANAGKIKGKVPIALMPGVISGISATMTVRGFSPQFYLLDGPTLIDFLPPVAGAPSVSHPLWSNPFWDPRWGYTQIERGYMNAGEGGKGGWIIEKGFVGIRGRDNNNRITIRGYTQNLGSVNGNAPDILGQAYQKDAAGQYIFPDTKLETNWVDIEGGDNGFRGSFQWVLTKKTRFINANNGSGNNHARYLTVHAFVDCDGETTGTRQGHDYKLMAEHGRGVFFLYRPKLPRNGINGDSYRTDGNTGDYFIIEMDATDAPGDNNIGTMMRLNVFRKIGGPSSFNIIGSRLDADIPLVQGAFLRVDDQANWYDDTGKTPNDPGWNYQTAGGKLQERQIRNADGSLVWTPVTVHDDGNVYLWNESKSLNYSYGRSVDANGNLILPTNHRIERLPGKNQAFNRLDPRAASAVTRTDFSTWVAKYKRLGEMARDGYNPDFWNEQTMDELQSVHAARCALWQQPFGIGQSPAPAGPVSFYIIPPITSTPETPPVIPPTTPPSTEHPPVTPPPVVTPPPPPAPDYKALLDVANAEVVRLNGVVTADILEKAQLHDVISHLNETIMNERSVNLAAMTKLETDYAAAARDRAALLDGMAQVGKAVAPFLITA